MSLTVCSKVRTAIQLTIVAVLSLCLVIFLDNRYRVLPQKIHNHLPQHHPGSVITDIAVAKCSNLNPLSSCKIEGNSWHRIEKDLYLSSKYFSKAYLYVKRKKEDELLPEDRVILDVAVGRLDPSTGQKGEGDARWDARAEGIWIKHSAKQHASDEKTAVTSVDVLFGADAVDPREGWEIKDGSLLLDRSNGDHQARLSIRRGKYVESKKPVPHINDNGRFKILQVADLHLSTGLGKCRDAMPPGYNGGKCDADVRTLEFVGKILDEEKPDFVVLTGDQVNGDTAPDAQTAIFKYADLFIKRKIPYVSIFGNHDDEKTLSRAAQMSLIETLPYSLSEAGPDDIDGVGNYFVEIYARGSSAHSALTLYMLDTHAYSPDEHTYAGYDWLKKNQVDWFKSTAQRLKPAHAKYPHHHMDLAFIHIPLPEYRDAANEIVGNYTEAVTAPGFNSHFRDALVEEGVVMVTCGQ